MQLLRDYEYNKIEYINILYKNLQANAKVIGYNSY